jgi:hypothetical protein
MNILTWCKGLIYLCIPNHFFSDVCGDLEEEYTAMLLLLNGKPKANLWLVKHTVSICTHFIFSLKNLLLLFLSVVSIAILLTMILSVFWLSALSDASVLNDVFWQRWLAGNSYQLFFEPILWQSIPQVFAESVDWTLWFYQPALIYALISLYILYKVNTCHRLSITQHSLGSMTLLLLPYLVGNLLFYFMDINMTESGPIVGFMWLTTLYLIMPISYQFSKEIKKSDVYFTE